MNDPKSKKGFNNSMLALILILIAYVLYLFFLGKDTDFFNLAFVILLITAFFLSVFGLVNSILGIKEPGSAQQIIGLNVNILLVLLFIILFIGVFNNL